MAIKIIETSPLVSLAETLAKYGTISIAFTAASWLSTRPVKQGLGGLLLVEEPIPLPYLKDYDAIDGEGPTRWLGTFDLSRWGILTAVDEFDADRIVGGAVIAWNTAGIDMLEGRNDLAVLWDLRVSTDSRGQGVGHLLFAVAEEWARSRGCREIKIETQNNNVAACRFYARQGCVLQTIRQNAYPELPDETQLIWHKMIRPLNGSSQRTLRTVDTRLSA